MFIVPAPTCSRRSNFRRSADPGHQAESKLWETKRNKTNKILNQPLSMGGCQYPEKQWLCKKWFWDLVLGHCYSSSLNHFLFLYLTHWSFLLWKKLSKNGRTFSRTFESTWMRSLRALKLYKDTEVSWNFEIMVKIQKLFSCLTQNFCKKDFSKLNQTELRIILRIKRGSRALKALMTFSRKPDKQKEL